MEARARLRAAHELARQTLTLAIETARYEAQRAHRQYARVDPDHRLGAGALARRWNETRAHVAAAAARLATSEGQPPTLREAQHHALRTVGDDWTTVGRHPAAPEARKKRIWRPVVQEIMRHTTQEPPEHVWHLHWPGGVHTAVRVARHTAGKHGRAPAHAVMAVLRELSQVCRDLPMAATLNRWGYRPGPGKTWRAHSVAGVRYHSRLPNVATGHAGRTLTQAARQGEVRATVGKRCSAQGT